MDFFPLIFKTSVHEENLQADSVIWAKPNFYFCLAQEILKKQLRNYT